MTSPDHVPCHVLGAVGVNEKALVDTAGAISPASAGWRVEWLAKSGDSWHRPADSGEVRQAINNAGIEVVTRLRVPDGLITSTLTVGLDPGGNPHARLDIENMTSAPIGLALVVHGGDHEGNQSAFSITVDDSSVTVGSTSALMFDRSPRAVRLGSDIDAVLDRLESETAARSDEAACSVPGLAAAAAVFPLTHRSTLSAAISLRTEAPASAPSALPDVDAVTNGWKLHLERGMRLVTADDAVDASLLAARRQLLMMAGDGNPTFDPNEAPVRQTQLRGAIALTLAKWGFWPEAAAVSYGLASDASDDPRDPSIAAAWLLAAAATHQYTDSVAVNGDDIAAAVAAIDRSTRRPRRRPSLAKGLVRLPQAAEPYASEHTTWAEAAMTGAAALLEAIGQSEPARGIEQRARDLAAARAAAYPDDVDPLVGVLAEWVDRDTDRLIPAPVLSLDGTEEMSTLQALLALPRRFVEANPNGLDIVAPPVPGGNWEIRDLPTRHGRFSVALRWHGTRAALLWEGSTGELTASSIDALWVSKESAGEVLLNPEKRQR